MSQSNIHSETIFHPFTSTETDGIVLPPRFNNPFYYQPHPLSVLAAEKLKKYLEKQTKWADEIERGKMFGVLIAKAPNGAIGFLAAFSGILYGSNWHPYFVPPIYDLQKPDGYFPKEEKNISEINKQINQLETSEALQQKKDEYKAALQRESITLEAKRKLINKLKLKRDELRIKEVLTEEDKALLIKESQYQKAELKRLKEYLKESSEKAREELQELTNEIEQLKLERKQRSAALQKWLFEQFIMLNAIGESKNLIDIFKNEARPTPPAGAGECCAPKLLQYAYSNHLHPICMAEFWMGASPKDEIRCHGDFYPSCVSKCKPILRHMLKGLDVEENQQMLRMEATASKMRIIYEDEWICAVNKPAGMLSVPSRDDAPSVYSKIIQIRPELDRSTIMVHRLDMDTSGVLLLAKDKNTHKALQAQFVRHEVKKKYIALLEGNVENDCGIIDLPLSPNHEDRPRQMIDFEHGKQSITHYEVIKRNAESTRIAFYPQTGRTHQLRVHSAHRKGLSCPIIGDPLYGHQSTRMYLHAESIEFTHPATGQRMTIQSPCEF